MQSINEQEELSESLKSAYTKALALLTEAVKSETPPWCQPEIIAAGLPCSGLSGKSYQGLNVLLLWHAVVLTEQSFTPMLWFATPICNTPIGYVRFTRNKPMGQLAIIHSVNPMPNPNAMCPVNISGLVDVLHKLELGAIVNDTASMIIASVSRFIEKELSLNIRNELYIRLRRSLRVSRAEVLVKELATAFVLANLRVKAAPSPSDIGDISSKNLALAAHIAWTISQRLMTNILIFKEKLWPPIPIQQIKTPKRTAKEPSFISPKDRLDWAIAHTIEVMQAVVDAEWIVTEQKTDIIAWSKRKPQESYRVIADILKGKTEFPTITNVVEQLIDDTNRQKQLAAELLHNIVPTELQSKDPIVSLAHILRERLRIGKLWPEEIETPFLLKNVWNALVRQHLRSNWHHIISEVSETDLINSIGPINKNINFVKGLSSAVEARSFTMIIKALTKSKTKVYDDTMLLDILSLPRLANAQRRENRRLRTIFSKLDNQQSQPPPTSERNDWDDFLKSILNNPYRVAVIRKSTGKLRRLDIPSLPLGQAQRVIAQILARAFPGTISMTAFMPHRSIAWHARMHAGARRAVMMDIEDFFGSVRIEQIRPWFRKRVFHQSELPVPQLPFEKVSPEGIKALEKLLFRFDTERPPFLPQGAPSSPIVANLAAVPLDRRVGYLADRAFGTGRWQYSRYADDLVLSTCEDIPDFEERALRILGAAIRSMGWYPASNKTRRWQIGHGELRLCGIRVPTNPYGMLRPVRDMQRRVRAAMHNIARTVNDGGIPNTADCGVVSYAYAITGDPMYQAWTSRYIHNIALAIAGPTALFRFLEAWASG